MFAAIVTRILSVAMSVLICFGPIITAVLSPLTAMVSSILPYFASAASALLTRLTTIGAFVLVRFAVVRSFVLPDFLLLAWCGRLGKRSGADCCAREGHQGSECQRESSVMVHCGHPPKWLFGVRHVVGE